MTDDDVQPNTDHPAPFSEPILAQLRVLVATEAARLRRPPVVLDPFAGIGRVHDLNDIAHTTGVELEPEWAACRVGTIVGDATRLPSAWSSRFDMVVTSPCYGNRLADAHEAKDKCKRCDGEGLVDGVTCRLCKGKGLSPRKNYRTSLGRRPSDGSAAVLQWGEKYRELHWHALLEMDRVLDDGGLMVVNMSNHYRGVAIDKDVYRSELQRVVEWWVARMLDLGLYVDAILPVRTRRLRHGANYALRAGVEHLICMRKGWPLVDEGS